MPIKPTTPPLWQNTLDLTAATYPPGGTLLANATGGGGGSVVAVTASPPLASSGGTTPNITHLASGVAAALYGDSTHVGQFTVDADGHVTLAANVAITGFTPNAITALTGDVTATGPGSVAATLANTAVTPASYGDATHVGAFTVDSKGRLTAASSVLITGTAPGGAAGGDLSGTYPNPTVAKINTVALGSTTATAGNLLIGSGSAWVTNAVSGDVTINSTGVTAIGTNKVANSQLAQMAAHTVKANITGSTANAVDSSLSAILDAELSSTQGSVIYRGASVWSALGPSTSGYVLKTLGAGANPVWAAGPGAAGITVGLDKDRPAASAGSIYQATDSQITYLSDNSVWYVNGNRQKSGVGPFTDSSYMFSQFAGANVGPIMSNPYTVLLGFTVNSLPTTTHKILIGYLTGSATTGWYLGTSTTNSNKLVVYMKGINSDAEIEFASMTALTTGAHSVAITYNGTQLILVLDGGSAVTVSVSGTYTVPSSAAQVTIGRYIGTGFAMNFGTISYLYGYASALSTGDKQTLTSTPGNYFPGSISTAPSYAWSSWLPTWGSAQRVWGSAINADGTSNILGFGSGLAFVNY